MKSVVTFRQIKKNRKRLAELITKFSRCRQEHNITDGCGGGKAVCTPCPFENEHTEMWNILGTDDITFNQGLEIVHKRLPTDVKKELHLGRYRRRK